MTHEDAHQMHPEVEARVREFVHALRSSPSAKFVLAIIVSGSACRGEEIWRNGRLISDIDLMLVTRHTNPHRSRALATIMVPFQAAGIDGGATPLPSLRHYRTFAFYEARMNGIIVWGNRNMDSLLPPVSPTDLPRWEALRVLANRMFEHLKYSCGRTTLAQASAKSYEALAEAALALEGRYRPSYRERLRELINNPPTLLAGHSYEAAITVLRSRLESQPLPSLSIEMAGHDLLSGLRNTLRQYLRTDGTVKELLCLLGQREHHWRHRVYWVGVHPRYGANTRLGVDPIIDLWHQAAVALLENPPAGIAQELVSAWKACPQIMRHHDAAYARETHSEPHMDRT